VTIHADEEATKWHEKQRRMGCEELARMQMVSALADEVRDRPDMAILLKDQFESARFTTFDVDDVTFGAVMTVRRLGLDTGKDILFRLGGQISGVAKHMQEVTAKKEEEKAKNNPVLQGGPKVGKTAVATKPAPKKLAASKKAPKKVAKRKGR